MRVVAALLLGLTVCLSGCSSRAPDIGQVQKDITEQLVAAFGEGVFTDTAFSSRGSANDIASPDGEARRVVYYDADLVLAKDVDFAAWNTPGVASLVTIFGAGPKGVTGAKTGGNKAGDEIAIHGSAIYKQDGGAWNVVVPGGFEPPVAPPIDNLTAPSASERLLTALGDAVHAVPTGTSAESQAVIDEELARAVATIQARISRLSQGYPIASGPDGGQYVRVAQALQAAKAGIVKFQALLTQGSIENIDLMREGSVPLGIVQADIAAEALAGEGAFAGKGAFSNLRALGSLFPESLHVVVRSNSPATSVRDLAGKKIALGPAGSGSRATAERILEAYGLRQGEGYVLDETPITGSLSALQAGTADAVLQVIGLPADAARTPSVEGLFKLLPLDDDIIAQVTAEGSNLIPGVIPRLTYPGLTTDVKTISVAAMLVTTTALSETEVAQMIKAVFGGGIDLLAAGSSQAAQISAATARTGLSLPLAAGAEAALGELAAQ